MKIIEGIPCKGNFTCIAGYAKNLEDDVRRWLDGQKIYVNHDQRRRGVWTGFTGAEYRVVVVATATTFSAKTLPKGCEMSMSMKESRNMLATSTW